MTLRTTRPIQSKRQALMLLRGNFGDATLRYVRFMLPTGFGGRKCPVIVVESYTRSREELEYTNEYELSRFIFTWLKDERLVRGTPYWGGRNTNEFEPTIQLLDMAWAYEMTPREPCEEELPDVYAPSR